jgi:hypothetical protein
MAISRTDCILLLSELQDRGIDTSIQLKNVYKSNDINLDVLKFINDNRQLDLTAFYEKLRKSYNSKKSNLYINIVKEIDNPEEVLITLSSLNLQLMLFAKNNASDMQMFLKHARFEEICKCLLNYSKTFDITNCIKLLRIIKCDLKCLESIK